MEKTQCFYVLIIYFVDMICIAGLNTVTFEIHLTNPCKVAMKICLLSSILYSCGRLVSVTVRLIALICLKLFWYG